MFVRNRLFAAAASVVLAVGLAPAATAAPATLRTPSTPASPSSVPIDWVDGSGGGMTVSWRGVWDSSTKMSQIDVRVCDSAPNNTNEATAALHVALRNPSTGAITEQTAPARLTAHQGSACADSTWNLGYSQQLYAVCLWFWGDEAPSDIWGTAWRYNPYL